MGQQQSVDKAAEKAAIASLNAFAITIEANAKLYNSMADGFMEAAREVGFYTGVICVTVSAVYLIAGIKAICGNIRIYYLQKIRPRGF